MSFWKPRRKNKPTPVIEQPLHPIGTLVSIGGAEYVAVRVDYTHDLIQLTYERVASFNTRLRVNRAPATTSRECEDGEHRSCYTECACWCHG